MADTDRRATWGRQLVSKLTCPNCWHSFFPEEALAVARHPELVGDPVAGSNEFVRFLPSRFNVKGEALDPKGLPTNEIACPRCHLAVSELMMEVKPLYISIVGSPASGKSYFITSMSWMLRQLLPQAELAFSDADPTANSVIHDYEHSLFMNPESDDPTEIRKTQRDDPQLHRTALLEGAPIRFPMPLQFLIWPAPQHPHFPRASQVGRIVVLYDNAGEDYLPGTDQVNSAVVQHLARSQIIMALFDPTQDPRFRAKCRSDDPQLTHGLRPDGSKSFTLHQETILREAAVRARRYLGLSQDKRLKAPLVVVVPKFDVWSNLAGFSIDTEPYTRTAGLPLTMDLRQVEQASDRIRELFTELCPEFVTTAEGLSEAVRYIPISSLGCSPELVQGEKYSYYGIRPRLIKPKWATVPLMYCLCRWAPGLISAQSKEANA